MRELIEKDAAIDVIMGQPPEPHYPSWYAEQIRALPPAQPERKKGRWILVHPLQSNDEAYMCSVCETGDYSVKPTDKYCKFCGAEMIQAEGEERWDD